MTDVTLIVAYTTDQKDNRYCFGDTADHYFYKLGTPDRQGNTHIVLPRPYPNIPGSRTYITIDRMNEIIKLHKPRIISFIYGKEIYE